MIVKVSLSGPFDLPENSELVSAVYWVYSPHTFVKPLTLEIQHCVAITTPSQCAQLTFVRTSCTQKKLPYNFKELDGGSFKPNTRYGRVSVMHFSGLAIQRRSNKAPSKKKKGGRRGSGSHSQTTISSSNNDGIDAPLEYCGKLYTCQRVNYWTVDFVVIQNLNVCIKAGEFAILK